MMYVSGSRRSNPVGNIAEKAVCRSVCRININTLLQTVSFGDFAHWEVSTINHAGLTLFIRIGKRKFHLIGKLIGKRKIHDLFRYSLFTFYTKKLVTGQMTLLIIIIFHMEV